MIRVAALTSGRNVPSARFRVRQHIEVLMDQGIHVREWAPLIDKNRPLPLWPTRLHVGWVAPIYLGWESLKAATRLTGVLGSHRADVTWLQRELLPGYPTWEPALRRPIVFDVDDAIWVARPFGASAIARTARRAAMVVAGNAYIADWFDRHAENVRVVPTAIDTSRFHPPPSQQREARDRFTIVWTGSAGNLRYLEPILPAIQAFMESHPDVEFKVIADRRPRFRLPDRQVRFVRWTPHTEASELRDGDVGIMPLPDDDWTRGKCGFKLLQYMSTGIPVVASPVGMNRDILAMGEVGFAATGCEEWRDALEVLYRDRTRLKAYGANGREVAEGRFDRRVVARELASVFRAVS